MRNAPQPESKLVMNWAEEFFIYFLFKGFLFLPAFLLAILVFLMIRHHRSGDRPFPLGCCRRCGDRLPGPGDSCLTCGQGVRCLLCGYDMRGNRSGVCPECGSPWEGGRSAG